MVTCPFCGAAETDRFEIEDRRFVVFACMFTPSFDRTLDEAGIEERLRTEYAPQGAAYFRQTCDRLHRFVVGPGGDAHAAP
ncbi:MAG: hypothetical protein QXG65_00180 [Thermoplasmata archaeon]